jgi:predicted ATPase
VTATIAAAIGVPVEYMQSARDAVADAIGDDHVLLTLDNLEQLTSAGPELATLLDQCPRLHLLITSRHVMRLRGEHEYPLAPLAVPGLDAFDDPDAVDDLRLEPAVALFVEHASATRPTFRLDATNAPAVAELCRRLDGLPLAIELVAAHIRLLSPEILLARLGDGIDLFANGSADLPDRQRTLRATLDWSYQLLDARERALFARLAVFTGGASLDALEAVCGGESVGDVLETLSALLEKSLLVLVEDASGGPRIGMLQTIWAYAREQLEATHDVAEVRDRHATWFLRLVLSCDPAHQAGATARWAELERELPNVRAAIAWRTEQNDGTAIGLFATSLWVWYWLAGRMSEGRVWIESLAPRLAAPGGRPDDEATTYLCEALGAVRFALGDYQGADGLLRRALAGYDAAGDLEGTALVSCMLAELGTIDGNAAETIEFARAAVAGSRARELDWGLAYALAVLGGSIRQHESVEVGLALQLEALEAAKRVGEQVLISHILGQLALGALSEGNLSEAGAIFTEVVDCARQTRHTGVMVFCLEFGAALGFAGRQAHDAAVLIGAADSIRERLDIPVWPLRQAKRAELVGHLTETLGPDQYSLAWSEGSAADPFALLPS